jgi:hypothetical protein
MPKERDAEETTVIFRRWRDTGAVIALFPEEPADASGGYCMSYMHVGQHGAANYHDIVSGSGEWGNAKSNTLPVDPSDPDVFELKAELEGIGYKLRILRKVGWRSHEKRRETARRMQ